MKRTKLFTIPLAVFVGITFSSQEITFANTTKSKIVSSTAASQKNVMSTASVKSLQTGLKRLGYFNYQVDGIFGSKTKNAVEKFQKANGLTVDGIVGSKTTSKLNQKLGEKETTSKSPSSRGSSGNVMQVINCAKRYLGVNYVYGGASSNAFDCSGFTMFVFKTVGINLPHSASGQAKLGTSVSRSNLSAGDLVFFETTSQGISHVGIYLGDGYFIHASSGAGHVTTSTLSSGYYAERFRGGSRILND